MPIIVSHEVHLLVLRITYAKGEVVRAANRVAVAETEVGRQEQILEAKKNKVLRLSAELEALAPGLKTEDLRPTKKMRPRQWRTGTLTAALIRLLQEQPGKGLPTTYFVMTIAKELKIPLTPREKYARFQDNVRRQLCEWVRRGYVERLHGKNDKHNSNGFEEGMWRWNPVDSALPEPKIRVSPHSR